LLLYPEIVAWLLHNSQVIGEPVRQYISPRANIHHSILYNRSGINVAFDEIEKLLFFIFTDKHVWSLEIQEVSYVTIVHDAHQITKVDLDHLKFAGIYRHMEHAALIETSGLRTTDVTNLHSAAKYLTAYRSLYFYFYRWHLCPLPLTFKSKVFTQSFTFFFCYIIYYIARNSPLTIHETPRHLLNFELILTRCINWGRERAWKSHFAPLHTCSGILTTFSGNRMHCVLAYINRPESRRKKVQLEFYTMTYLSHVNKIN
jgi:hypothetical protein